MNMEKLEIKKYKTFKELQESPEFKQGVKDFKEGKTKPQEPVKIIFVKKLVTKKEWDSKYSKEPGYCNLGTEIGANGRDKMVKMAFIIPTFQETPFVSRLTDEEILSFDNYRRAKGQRPYPMTKRNEQGEEID
jgi:hypothetical protein